MVRRFYTPFSRILKGDIPGHAFHGNQYEAGSGEINWVDDYGKPKPSPIPFFQKNLKEFYESGGKVERYDSQNKVDDLLAEVREKLHPGEAKDVVDEAHTPEERKAQGIRFIEEAVREHLGHIKILGKDSQLLVARDKDGNIVAAVNVEPFQSDDGEKLSVGYLGSTKDAHGAATALEEQVAQLAAEKGVGVTSIPTADSMPYHKKIGRSFNYRGASYWTPDECKAIASLPNPDVKVTKGDVDGHPFHGNQWEAVGSAEAVSRSKDFIADKVLLSESESRPFSNNTLTSDEKDKYIDNLAKIVSDPAQFQKALDNFTTNGKPDPAKAVMAMLGNLGKPSVVSEAEFGKGDEYQRLFTGISSAIGKGAETISTFAYSSNPPYGGGIYGTAFYTSELPNDAIYYADERGEDRDHMVMQMRLDWSNPDSSNSGMNHVANYRFDKEKDFADLLKANGFSKENADLLTQGLGEVAADALCGYKYTRSSAYIMVYDRSILQMSNTYAFWGKESPTATGDEILANQEVNEDTGVSAETIKTPLAKGDVPGHVFHGNQWSSGMGGTTPDGRSYNELEAQAKELSSKLGYGDKFAENLVRVCADSTTLGKYAEINEAGRNQLKVANLILDRIGNNNPPKVVSPSEFASVKSDLPTLYTGISDHRSPASDKISDFAYGQGTKVGAGAFGRAWYATTDKSGAEDYARQWSDTGKTVGGVMNLKLQSGSKVMDYDKAIGELKQTDTRTGTGLLDDIDKVTEMISAGKPELEGIAHTVAQTILAGDENITLAMMGVDALTTNINENGEKYVMLLNRSKLVVSSQYDKTDERGITPVAIPAKPENVVKGDVEGHVFHGNQWTTGKEGVATNDVMEDGIDNELSQLFDPNGYADPSSNRMKMEHFGPRAKEYVAKQIAAEMSNALDSSPSMNKKICGLNWKTKEPSVNYLRKKDQWVLGWDGSIRYLGEKSQAASFDFHPGEGKVANGNDPQVLQRLREQGVSQLLTKWAQTSGDNNTVSLAIQQATKDEFRLSSSADFASPDMKDLVDKEYAKNGDVYRSFVRAQYNLTQKFFAERGIKSVDVYRGFIFHSEDKPDWSKGIKLRPISAFTYSKDIATRFSLDTLGLKDGWQVAMWNDEHIVIGARVPIKNILSCALTGVGCLNEKEITVLGRKNLTDFTVSRFDEDGDEIKKGDVVGHIFHGNQWTVGEGGHASTSVMENGVFGDIKELFGEPHKQIMGSYSYPKNAISAVFRMQYAPRAKAYVAEQVAAEMSNKLDANPMMDQVLCGEKFIAPYLTNKSKWAIGPFLNTGLEEPTLVSTDDPNYRGGTPKEGDTIVSGDDPRLRKYFREQGVSKMVNLWAQTSNDNNPKSLALQKAAKDEFNLEGTKSWAGDNTKEAKEAYHGVYGELYRTFLRAQYNVTQKFFADRGIKTVDIYRGFNIEENESTPSWAKKQIDSDAKVPDQPLKSTASIPLRPLSAFSYDKDVATRFSNTYGSYSPHQFVISAKIPVSQILSMPLSGLGCLDERELVVLGGKIKADVEYTTPEGYDARLTEKGLVESISKGDVDGHIFHGNQYEQIAGSAQTLPLEKLVRAWAQTDSPARWRNLDQPWSQQLQNAVLNAPPSKTELFSGVSVPSGQVDKLYGVGKKLEMTLASFTSKQSVANDFASKREGYSIYSTPKSNLKLVLHLPVGTRALDANQYGGVRRFHEQIVSGNFVVANQKTIGDYTHIYLQPDTSVVEKGDVSGHVFHGNQWTGGEGSAEGALLTGDQVKSAVMSQQGINEFNRIMSKQGYLTYPQNHPLYGGCGVVMKALQNIYPNGKPVAIGEPITPEEGEDYPPIFVQHYALQIGDDKFVDGAGVRSLAEIAQGNVLGKYWQVLPATPELVGSFQGIATCTDQEAKEYANVLLEQAGVTKSVSKAASKIWSKFAPRPFTKAKPTAADLRAKAQKALDKGDEVEAARLNYLAIGAQFDEDNAKSVKKGDTPGHQFHGNQWTEVGNITTEVASFLSTNANKFYKSGGTTKTYNGPTTDISEATIKGIGDKARGLENQLAQTTDPKEQEQVRRLAMGYDRMESALRDIVAGQPGIIAYDKNGEIASVMTLANSKTLQTSRPYVKVLELGSTNKTPGSATTLEIEAAKYAANKGVFLWANYTGNSRGYHQLIGRSLDREWSGSSEWTADECKAIASLNLGAPDTITKGDVEGHPFRGNQWEAGVESGNAELVRSRDAVKYGIRNEVMSVIPNLPYLSIYASGKADPTNDAEAAKGMKAKVCADIAQRLGSKFDDQLADSVEWASGIQINQSEKSSFLSSDDRYFLLDGSIEYIGNVKDPNFLKPNDDAEYKGNTSLYGKDVADSIRERKAETIRSDYNDGVPGYFEGGAVDTEGNYGQILKGDDPRAADAIRQQQVSKLIQLWALTSNGSGRKSSESLAMQEAAKQEFGLKNTMEWTITPEAKEGIDRKLKQKGELYRAFLRAQYDSTQSFFQRVGVTKIPLYRGMRWDEESFAKPEWAKKNGETQIELRPLSSWTYDKKIANDFATDQGAEKNGNGIILEATIPISRILSLPITGVGCLHEKEVVVLGGKEKVNIASSHNADEADDEDEY